MVLLLVITALVLSFWLMLARILFPHEGPPNTLLGDARVMQEGFRARCGRPTQGDEAIVVKLIHSDDKAAWMQRAAAEYMTRCPNTQLTLVSMSDLEAIDAIARADELPTAWAPSNRLAVRYFADRWHESAQSLPLLLERGDSLLRSPTVLLVWEDRKRALESLLPPLGARGATWARSVCATLPFDPTLSGLRREQLVPGTWLEWSRQRAAEVMMSPPLPDEAILQSWGRVSIAYASPSRSSLGMAALSLMAHDFLLDQSAAVALTGEAFNAGVVARQDALQRWLRRCQAGLEPPIESARLLTDTMFHVGDESYDGVITSESLVFSILERINEHGDAMRRPRVIYPELTIVNDHPIVYLFPDEPAAKESLDAAKRFTAFLQSKEMQLDAIARGFRPSSERVQIRSFAVGDNPFMRARHFGVQLDPTQREPAELTGAALRRLVETWEDATRRD